MQSKRKREEQEVQAPPPPPPSSAILKTLLIGDLWTIVGSYMTNWEEVRRIPVDRTGLGRIWCEFLACKNRLPYLVSSCCLKPADRDFFIVHGELYRMPRQQDIHWTGLPSISQEEFQNIILFCKKPTSIKLVLK